MSYTNNFRKPQLISAGRRVAPFYSDCIQYSDGNERCHKKLNGTFLLILLCIGADTMMKCKLVMFLLLLMVMMMFMAIVVVMMMLMMISMYQFF